VGAIDIALEASSATLDQKGAFRKADMMKVANEKVWLVEDGTKLVKDGDPKASRLFAMAGATLEEKALEGIKNADDFFKTLNAPAESASENAGHKASHKTAHNKK
jgi:hypothetical protein